jgi:hypothetical protein
LRGNRACPFNELQGKAVSRVKLIRTIRKDKLPRKLSYPLGAQAVSEALHDVPQRDLLNLRFLDKEYPVSYWKLKKAGSDLPVLKAEYRMFENRLDLALEGLLDIHDGEYWRLYVYPVESDIRAKVRRALLEIGLSVVSSWLSKPRPDTWKTGIKSCKIVLCDDNGFLDCLDEEFTPAPDGKYMKRSDRKRLVELSQLS